MEGYVMFHTCPSCKFVWSTRADFLADAGVELLAYKVSFADLMAGVFLFQHRCKGLVTLHAGEFADLYHGPIFSEPQTGSEDCPGLCLRKEDFRPCPVKCECAFVREVLQIIKRWPKREMINGEMLERLGQSS